LSVKEANVWQLRQRVTRVEIAVVSDLLSEPVVHECTKDRLTMTEFGLEILHQDGKGFQLVPWGRVVRLDFREGE
jgi:hypothetical protein